MLPAPVAGLKRVVTSLLETELMELSFVLVCRFRVVGGHYIFVSGPQLLGVGFDL